MKLHHVLLAFALAGLAGCGFFGTKKTDAVSNEATADKMFRDAKESLNNGDFNKAIKLLEAFESKFPYGAQAQQAILDTAWAHYRVSEYPLAVSNADRFIKLYPNHSSVDYAYYLKGLAQFGDELGLFKFLANEDISERDPKARREAYQTFRDLVEKYPASTYVNDSRLRMQHLLNSLAEYEVHVARYYYRRAAYVAAVNRAQLALTTYPETAASRGALEVMIDAYKALGKNDLAADTQRILAKTYPNTVTASSAATSGRPWWRFWGSGK